jgi:hypothetical protein
MRDRVASEADGYRFEPCRGYLPLSQIPTALRSTDVGSVVLGCWFEPCRGILSRCTSIKTMNALN